MKTIILGLAATGAALALSSCATLNEEQCAAGDWSRIGYVDGAAGHGMSRLDDHAKACAKFGIAPDPAVYGRAREDGLRTYCTPGSGFSVGRRGGSYGGVCRPEEEREFLPAFEDGRFIHAAESALSSARSEVDSRARRLEELDDKLRAKESELNQQGLTDEQREAIRNRIREVRDERQDTRRQWRDAQDALRDAERRWDEVRWRFGARYRL